MAHSLVGSFEIPLSQDSLGPIGILVMHFSLGLRVCTWAVLQFTTPRIVYNQRQRPIILRMTHTVPALSPEAHRYDGCYQFCMALSTLALGVVVRKSTKLMQDFVRMVIPTSGPTAYQQCLHWTTWSLRAGACK